ncbi:MAG: DNA polymerase Y family protein [Acidobacteria bacterium]|nr:DNA polymerase Y family protein [Acidobacteriota bacterium]
MFAAIHLHPGHHGDPAASARLTALAQRFSPSVELPGETEAILSISGLERMMGGPAQIASEIARRAHELGLAGNIAVAASPDTALIAARHRPGATVIPPGEEMRFLGNLPLAQLSLPPEPLAVLEGWGIRTLAEFCALPERGVVERLGQAGQTLWRLARGGAPRPLRELPRPASFEERLELDHPVDRIEPLLFMVARLLGELCGRLARHTRATTEVRLKLDLEESRTHTRLLQLPFATRDARTLLKILQLDLEAHPAPAAVVAVTVGVQPVAPRVAQSGLFTPPVPQPEKLELTLGRIRGLVGADNVGSPELLDTHRPDAWTMRTVAVVEPDNDLWRVEEPARQFGVRLAFRYFRPPLKARVDLDGGVPVRLFAPGLYGKILRAAGPWRGSGDWWRQEAWDREDWDIEMAGGALYRIFHPLSANLAPTVGPAWYIEGNYD